MTDPQAPLQQISPRASGENNSSGEKRAPTTVVVPPAPPRAPLSYGELWLRRITVLLFVTLCAAMGVLLVILPWSLQWTANRLLWGYPEVREILGYGFVRGLCSGLGILDLWIGFREAAHYHEEPHPAGKKS